MFVPLQESILKKAQDKKLITVNLINIRDFATNNYKTVDDKPYGGGAGMIMKVDIIDRALEHTKKLYPKLQAHTILLDPQGKRFTQKEAIAFSQKEHLIFVCGHYEGVDARVRELVDDVVSIGDFVVTGGELPAMCMVDSISRLVPGVLRNETAVQNETFMGDYREPPQYTRPEEYKGMKVPDVLLGGNHKKIEEWKSQFSQKKNV